MLPLIVVARTAYDLGHANILALCTFHFFLDRESRFLTVLVGSVILAPVLLVFFRSRCNAIVEEKFMSCAALDCITPSILLCLAGSYAISFFPAVNTLASKNAILIRAESA